MAVFTNDQLGFFKSLNAPAKIQTFLDEMPINFEEHGRTLFSPREVLSQNKAHCVEGALLAAAALALQGLPPLLVDLETDARDIGHVVAVFNVNGMWGALSKTNHAVLRYREPIFRDIRELAASYFHEYFLDTGEKTLRAYTEPIDLRAFDSLNWMTSENHLWWLLSFICNAPHLPLVPDGTILRSASEIEIEAGKLTQWPPPQN